MELLLNRCNYHDRIVTTTVIWDTTHDVGVSCSECKMTCHSGCSRNIEKEAIWLNCCAMIDQTQQEELNNANASVKEQNSQVPEKTSSPKGNDRSPENKHF